MKKASAFSLTILILPMSVVLSLALWLLLPGCIGQELTPLVEVTTNQPQPTGLGVLSISGMVSAARTEKVLEDHGFIWAENVDIEEKDFLMNKPNIRAIHLGKLEKDTFSIKLYGLKKYSIRAFVVSDNRVLYGRLKSYTFVFEVKTDTVVNQFNDEIQVSAIVFGLEALKDIINDRGHILATDTSNLYVNKPYQKISSLKSSNDDGAFISKFSELTFNTTYYAKAYVKTKRDSAVYSSKILKIRMKDGWIQTDNLPDRRANMVAGQINGIGYVSVGCADEKCLRAGENPMINTYHYNPSNDSWGDGVDFRGIAVSGAVSFTIDNKLYVGLGKNRGTYNQKIYCFDPALNQNMGNWVETDTFPAPAREGAVAFVIGDKAYIGSGSAKTNANIEQFFNDFYEYEPGAPPGKRWGKLKPLPLISTPGGKADSIGRSNAVAFSIGGLGYVGSGFSLSGTDLSDFWAYNPDMKQWKKVDFLPEGGRRNAVGFSLNKKGYVGLGQIPKDNNFLADLWEFDPSQADGNQWQKKASFPNGGRAYSAAFTIGNKAYVGGGYKIIVQNNNLAYLIFDDFWIYTPEIN